MLNRSTADDAYPKVVSIEGRLRIDAAWLLRVATFAGLAVLAQVAMLGDLNAVGITLAVESTILGLWAAFIAVKATEDAKAILDAVEGVRETARDLAASAKAEREVLDRLLAREELELLREVRNVLPAVRVHILSVSELPPDRVIQLTRHESESLYKALIRPLEAADGINLPACRTLYKSLSPLTWLFGPPEGEEDPDTKNFYPSLVAAIDEVQSAIAARVSALRR